MRGGRGDDLVVGDPVEVPVGLVHREHEPARVALAQAVQQLVRRLRVAVRVVVPDVRVGVEQLEPSGARPEVVEVGAERGPVVHAHAAGSYRVARMAIRKLRVQIETERLRISGTLQLPTEGYRSRVTDYLNGQDTGFFALTDAEIAPIDGAAVVTRDYVAVGVRHIVALAEVEDLGVVPDDSAGPGVASYAAASAPPPPPES